MAKATFYVHSDPGDFDKAKQKKYGCKILTHVHDEDCPKCGFPETIIVRNAKTMKPIAAYCSAECGWEKKLK